MPPDAILDPEQHQSLLYSSDLELGEATQRQFEIIERLKPRRVVDTMSEIRFLAQSPLRYGRQILALKHYFARNEVTAILLADMRGEHNDGAVHSIAHCVINLEQLAPLYGDERRRMRIAFQGVLRGVPTFFGGGDELMGADAAADTCRE